MKPGARARVSGHCAGEKKAIGTGEEKVFAFCRVVLLLDLVGPAIQNPGTRLSDRAWQKHGPVSNTTGRTARKTR